MSISGIDEAAVEQAALAWLGEIGYAVAYGPDIAPGEDRAERTGYGEVVLRDRLDRALVAISPDLPREAIDEAIRKATRSEDPNPYDDNRSFHKLLTDGVDVEFRDDEGRIKHDKVWLVDFADPDRNDWLAVNQFTVVEGEVERRPDVVLFINGLPLAILELKSPSAEQATLKGALNQLQTYKAGITSIFRYNEVLVVSDGVQARAGTLTATWEWFKPWRTVDGDDIAPSARRSWRCCSRASSSQAGSST